MSDIQKKINDIQNKNVNAILSGINSDSAIVVMNAIMVGTQIKLNNEDFIKGVMKAKDSDTVLLGVSIRNVAKASLHLIGFEEYKGDDPDVIKLIESKFDF